MATGDDDSLIILTVTMNRLLSWLLEHRGQVVTRDELLENVWDSHGLRSSNHTLNKYISEIRKQFRNFGVSEGFITTLPKIGFMLSSDVNIQIIVEKQQEIAPAMITDNKPEKNDVQKVDVTPSSKPRLVYTIVAFGMLAACAFLFSTRFWSLNNMPVQKKDIQTFFSF